MHSIIFPQCTYTRTRLFFVPLFHGAVACIRNVHSHEFSCLCTYKHMHLPYHELDECTYVWRVDVCSLRFFEFYALVLRLATVHANFAHTSVYENNFFLIGRDKFNDLFSCFEPVNLVGLLFFLLGSIGLSGFPEFFVRYWRKSCFEVFKILFS